MPTDTLVSLASTPRFPRTATEAARVIVVHDLAVALDARHLIGTMLDEPLGAGPCTDLATGHAVDAASAVSRNGQLVHALTQDDTLLPAMTHVGATALPLLLALGELEDAPVGALLDGFCASFAAAEALGQPVAAALSSRGIRPTPVIGPPAAVVGAARMLGWAEPRLRVALGRVASTSFGTVQPWIDGSQDWLFQIAATGLASLAAARSSASPWQPARDPWWGRAGAFACLGLSVDVLSEPTGLDLLGAATRARLKRFPACACNQVPLALLQQAMAADVPTDELVARLAPPEAGYPGVDEVQGLDTWTTRLMSLPYALAVMAETGGFTVADLQRVPDGVARRGTRGRRVLADPDLRLGQYRLDTGPVGGPVRTFEADLGTVGRPDRDELSRAAAAAIGRRGVRELLAILDDPAAPVRALLRRTQELS